jgi:arylsulfatase
VGGAFHDAAPAEDLQPVPGPLRTADITSNTYWDWLIDEVGGVYGIMDDVFQFVGTFKEYPPGSFPPSFNPANILESTLEGMKQRQELRRSIDPERIRGTLNEMIKQQLEQRAR